MRLSTIAPGKATTATTTGATVLTGVTGAELGQRYIMRSWSGLDGRSSLVGVIGSSSSSQVGDLGLQADLRT